MALRANLRSVVALAFLLGLPGLAQAAGDMIGLFADASASVCAAAVVPYQPVNVYVVATLDRLDTIIAAEFRLEGYPGSPGYPLGQCTPYWETTLIIGQLGGDVALAFNPPLGGSTALLGRLEFLAYADTWIGANQAMSVGPASAQGRILLVDESGGEHDVLGGRFTFKCSGDCGCGPGGTASVSFSEIKERY